MPRIIYSFIFYLVSPLVVLRLLYRANKNHAYRHRIKERFGIFNTPDLKRPIWIHAASVGETMAAVPLVKKLRQEYPDQDIVVTSQSPTGSERVRSLLGETVFHVYAPYDIPGCVKRFLSKIQPVMLIILETELWPNMVHYSKSKGASVILASARLSAKSASGYQKVLPLVRPMFKQLDAVAAQNEDAAARFRMLGVSNDRVSVKSNLKFDFAVEKDVLLDAQALRSAVGEQRLIWVAASTHEGEENILLAVHNKILKRFPSALLILVPRHPERFEEVYRLCQEQFHLVRRSTKVPIKKDHQILLGDKMGELLIMYGAADVAFVGGSLIERGGHNPLEPACLAKPIIMGPHVFNFEQICQQFNEQEGLVFIQNEADLYVTLVKCFEDAAYRKKLGDSALLLVRKNRGALDKLLGVVRPFLAS